MDIWIEFWIEMFKPMVPIIQPILSIPVVDQLISDWFDLNTDWMLQLYVAQHSVHTNK